MSLQNYILNAIPAGQSISYSKLVIDRERLDHALRAMLTAGVLVRRLDGTYARPHIVAEPDDEPIETPPPCSDLAGTTRMEGDGALRDL